MRVAKTLVVMALLILSISSRAIPQTASTGAVVGTVTDSTGAVVPNATVTLTNTETNVTSQTSSNAQGGYNFPNVLPGRYGLTVKLAGFRTATISDLTVEVNRSNNVNVILRVGEIAEVIEVKTTGMVELQATDAQIGNVIGGESVLRLPNLGRNASELLALQPAATQGLGGFPRRGVRVAGAIDDQNTISIDGIDVTNNVIGGEDGLNTMIPVPTESVEEFRVGVSNPNASFGRASGGQMALVGRRGTNAYHGTAYWYHINDDLNANSWTLNRLKPPQNKRPEFKDNRFGGRFGGPIIRDRLFIFGHYEGRRNPQSSQILRFVPSDLLKQGTLQFTDCASGKFDGKGNCTGGGNLIPYNLATSKLCGSGGNAACDPRGLGLNPTVSQLWSLMPTGNDPSGGDTLNTLGFRSSVSTPLNDDFWTVRPDYNFTQNWRVNSTFTYFRHRQVGGPNVEQLDIRGGNPKSVITTPAVASAAIASLTGQIANNLINISRFGYVRRRGWTRAQAPSETASLLNLTGSSTSQGAVAIAPALALTGFLDAPIDVDTQRARFQATFSKSFQFSDDLTWVKGTHTLQFGTDIRDLPTIHVRADKVVGSLSSLVAFLDADVSGFLSIPAANRPPTCAPASGGSPAVTTKCINQLDLQRWDRLYAATLGLVDTLGVLRVRDGQLNPLPLGTNLINDTSPKTFYFYGQDTWRIRRSLTLAYGLAYGWQTAPKDTLGRQTLIIDNTTGKVLTARDYLTAKRQAAEQGQFFNPQLAYSPVRTAKRDVFDVDWTNVAPRAAIAWNPAFREGFLGRMFGERRSVVRGGFGITYDRTNTVQSVLIPMLGVGFGQTITVFQPLCNATGAGGVRCDAAAGSGNPGASSFRVGTDGTLPLPTLPAASNPVVPQPPFGETLSFQVDPDTKVGRSYNVDFTIQREMPGNMLLELGYVGHFGRRLPQAVGLNQSPYMFKDTVSGQTFAQAFDAAATQLRAGVGPFLPNGNPNPAFQTQPWFENMMPGFISTKSCTKLKATTATNCLAGLQATAFQNGLVSSLFNSINGFRFASGRPTFNNLQVLESFMRTYVGESNYNGLVLTVTKRPSHGLSFAANYTYSKALDDGLRNQNSAGFYSNSFFTGTDYGPSLYDRGHVLNGTFVYELPFGRGHRLATGNALDKVIGGWYTSGIFTAFSGLPLTVTAGGQTWGGGLIFPNGVAAIPTGSVTTGVHGGVAGSGNIGTTGDPATGGTGLNVFSDPEAASKSFRRILLSQDTSSGAGNPLRGLAFWNFDFSIGKATKVTERVNIRYSFDFFNLFNNVNFADPALDLNQNLQNFGVINTQLVPPNRQSGSRWIEFGLRIEF